MTSMRSLIIFTVTLILFKIVGGWQYERPQDWPGICQRGQSQSPVNLEDEIYQVDLEADPLVFHRYDQPLRQVKLTNDGHTVRLEVMLNQTNNIPMIISGGGLGGSYLFSHLHFHWGDSSSVGSEHHINGEVFPLEIHMVHYNSRYGNIAQAVAKPDGLAVLAILVRLQRGNNQIWKSLFNLFENIQQPEKPSILSKSSPHEEKEKEGEVGSQKKSLSELSLASFMPSESTDFYRYNGSLTTPGCSESVIWTVFRHQLFISEGQMSFFRSLKDSLGQPLVNNFRPVQQLHHRNIFSNFIEFESPRAMATKYDNDTNNHFQERWRTKQEKFPKNVDHFFLLIMSIIIFFMQCGFAFMEAGAVRSKNTVNILIKNWLDMCIGALVYWAVGFALTFGDSFGRILGTSYFFFYSMPAYKLSKWFFQFVFAATAATLVSGSLAERCSFTAYIVYSIMITGFIYPIIAHWVWHPEGWLSIMGFHDFAGSAVVHLTGAVCALVGCVLMGPRIGRFDKKGRPVPMPGHSVPLSALGGLILIFGFFACNGTKQGSISNPDDGIVIATAIVNTALGTSAAGLCTLIFNKTGIVPGTGGNYSFLITMNGSLTGTVALCAGCNVYPAWAAVIIGALSGPLYLSFNWILLRCQIDDPLDAIPVHGGGGIWGTLAVYLFKWDGILMSWTSEAAKGLGWNIIGLLAIVSWTGINCFFMFFTLKKMGQLRVEPEQEFKGMDLLKHGESAYPADAWVEAQYMKEDAVMSDQLTPDGEIEPANKKNGGSNSQSRDGLPPNMRFSRAASYNNPHEMFPSASKLFSGMTAAAGNVTKLNMAKSSTSMTVVNEGEEGTKDEKERLHVIHELAPVGKEMVAVAVAVSNNSMSSTSERNENTYI